jgi:hypothetical protein
MDMGKLIQIDITEDLQKIQQSGIVSNIATTKNWQQEIVSGNDAMAKELFFTAYDHYKIALNIAMNLFKVHQNSEHVPDNVVPAIVVSYLNICELWRKQNKTTARKGYLCAAFDYLAAQLQLTDLCGEVKEQLWCGLDKVYMEIIEMGDAEILALKREVLMTL